MPQCLPTSPDTNCGRISPDQLAENTNPDSEVSRSERHKSRKHQKSPSGRSVHHQHPLPLLEDCVHSPIVFVGDCDRLPWPVSLVHFDACVNTGVTQAARFLQRSVGADPDGRIGPKTLEALRSLLTRETPLAVAERLLLKREPFYRRLVQVDPSQKRFLQGWLNRVSSLKKALAS